MSVELQKARRARLNTLIETLGCATSCQLELATPALGRWALMEADEGSADNGGPWWTVDNDWQRLLEDSASQEYPHDWPATTLFDLDSEFETDVEKRSVYAPSHTPHVKLLTGRCPVCRHFGEDCTGDLPPTPVTA